MDKTREDFEAWFDEQMCMPISSSNGTVVRLMYRAWQASRKALVVELPPVCDCHSDDKDKGYDICHYAVQSKLQEQGINFKVEGADRWSSKA